MVAKLSKHFVPANPFSWGKVRCHYHIKLDFEIEVVDKDNAKNEKVSIHLGRLTDCVTKLTTTDQNTSISSSVCKQVNKLPNSLLN